MVYKGLKSSFVSLGWPWSGRSLPQGEPVGVQWPWTGAQCGWAPSSPTTNYITNPSLRGWHFCIWLVGWPIAAGWLTGYLRKGQLDPPPRQKTSCGQVCDYFSQTDLWSDVPLSRDIWWPSMLLLQSGWPLVRHTPSRDILWLSVLLLQSDWPLVRLPPTIRLWVRLTFSQASSQPDLWSDVPPWQRHVVAKCVTASVRITSGWMYPKLWLGFGSSWHLVMLLVKLTLGQMYPPAETCGGQVCCYFCQFDLWSDVPNRDIWWAKCVTFGQGWPVVRCPPRQRHLVAKCDTTASCVSGWPLVRCICQQAETSCGQVWYYFRSGWPVYWRVNLVPAAAVILAPWADIKVLAVKKLILCFVFHLLRWLNLSHMYTHTILCKKP